jgi:hypothetical protein
LNKLAKRLGVIAGAKRRGNPAARVGAPTKKVTERLQNAALHFYSAPAGVPLDCFAIGDAKRRRSSNG